MGLSQSLGIDVFTKKAEAKLLIIACLPRSSLPFEEGGEGGPGRLVIMKC